MSVNVLYRTTATATGGRDGQASSEDGRFAVTLSTPKALGGAGGEGSNPEQLFAAGYSACFIGAMKVAGQQLKLRVPAEATVTATVGIGPRAEGGFGITADLVVSLPGIERRRRAHRRTGASDLPLLQRHARQCGRGPQRRLILAGRRP